MIDASPSPARIVRFGVFELDLRSGELRKGGLRVSLPEQSLQVLVLLLEHPGELVTRDELRQRLWPAGTYVDFEHGLNAIVKRLRDALADAAEAPRFIETLPRRGYRFIAPVNTKGVESASIELPVQRQASKPGRALVLGAAAVGVITLGSGAYLIHRTTQSQSAGRPRSLTRLTFKPGLQTQPTWSPDRRFIAYSSDQSGNFDIWVQPVAGGDAVHVTRSPGRDWQPDWSPDGSQIAFRSERAGGGIYLVPPLGGHERKLTTFGYAPRWSPDGTRILFSATEVSGPSERPSLYLVRLDGSPPQQILTAFLDQFLEQPAVAWHPDGQRVSVWAPHQERVWPSFWTVPISGGTPVRSQADPDVRQVWTDAVLQNYDFAPFTWMPSGRAFFFIGSSQEVRNIWKVEVDPNTLRWLGRPERMTTGPGAEQELALSRDGRSLAFATSTRNSRIWVFPFNTAAGRIVGEGQPVTPEEWNSWAPDLTDDGRKLLYLTEQPGHGHRHQLTEKSLPGLLERPLAIADLFRGEDRGIPLRWSRDGRRIAYKYLETRDRQRLFSLRMLDTATGQEHPITSPYRMGQRGKMEGTYGDRYENAYGWSADGQWIVAAGARYGEGRATIALVPLTAAPHAETQTRIVTSDACHALYDAAISPDDRWIAFLAVSTVDNRVTTLYVVPRSGGAWTQLTEGLYSDRYPRWSPDGRAVYFLSARGGDANVWGIRFDPAQGRPVGDPFRVTSFESPRQAIANNIWMHTHLALARDRLALSLRDVRGGVWMLDNVDR